MIWTAAYGHERCVCRHEFAVNEPMALLTSKQLRRCAPCVSGTPVDWDAVHAVIEQRRSQRPGETVATVTGGFERVTPGSLDAFLKRADTFGIKGRKQPKPYADVADDPSVRRTSEGDR